MSNIMAIELSCRYVQVLHNEAACCQRVYNIVDCIVKPDPIRFGFHEDTKC